MGREIITISDDGVIAIPENPGRVRMTVGEIAALLGIYYQTVKRHIRAIERAGIADGDYSMTCISKGMTAYPMYYGLEMLAALAFRIHSWQADKFRQWLIERATHTTAKHQLPITMLFPVRENASLN
jgi:hypothetical protein